MKAKEARLKMFCRTERHKRKGIGEKGPIPYHLLFGMSLAVVLLFAGIGIVSATADYYVATWGCDNNTGTSVDEPWQHPSYAAQQAQAGDTIFLVNGTWYDEHVAFANSGNATHPITMTAYNGTPTLDGVDDMGYGVYISNEDYINITNLKIIDYYYGVYVTYSNHTNLANISIESTGQSAIIIGYDCWHITIDNCKMKGSGWNMLQLTAHGAPSGYITITNCTLQPPFRHAGIDLNCGYGLNHIDIIGNVISENSDSSAIFSHNYNPAGAPCYWNISNNRIYNNRYNGIYIKAHDSVITKNTIYNCSNFGISMLDASNVTISGNTLYLNLADTGITPSSDNTTLFEENNISYYRVNNEYGIIRNPQKEVFTVLAAHGAKIVVEFTDGKVFDVTSTSPSVRYTLTPPTYYSDKSNSTMNANAGNTAKFTVTTYNMTAKPVAATVFVTVNKFDTFLSQGEFLVDFAADTTDGNEVVFTVWDLKPGYYYLIKRDGADVVTEQANSSGYIQFSNSQWSAHRFTIEESLTPPATGTISGIVTNASSAPIEDAMVEAGGQYASTDEYGEYTITSILEGIYTETASADGYENSSGHVTVIAGQITTVNFELTPVPPGSDLTGVWHFEEGSGEIAEDTSVNNNEGTLTNMNPATAWVAGKLGTALQFDGIDDYVDCGHDASLDITDTITIETWLNPNVAGEGVRNLGPVCKAEAGVDWSWQLRYNAPGGYMGFQFNGDPEGSTWVSVNQNLTPGEWYHVAGTFDGTTIRCYLNGVETDTNHLSAIKSSNARLFIGQDGWGNIFNGVVDELRIYNRALTAEEIQADYEAGFVELNSLSGKVTSPCGIHIPNATVTLTTRSGAEINTTQTDSTGHYAFANVSPDYYDITATKRSYWSNTNNVTVTADDPETADIVLCQKGDLNTNSEPADAGDLAMMADATAAGTSDVTYDLDGDGNPADEADLTLLKDVSVGVAVLE